jgi:PIN domain
MNGPVAVLDANVLYPAVLRDLLMQFAVGGLFQARWTRQIEDEWTRNLLADRPDISATQIAITRTLMARVVPDARVHGHEPLIADILLPDPNDRHVLAAAVRTHASVIVTKNLRDFPPSALEPRGLVALHPDMFVMGLAAADPLKVIASVRSCRTRLVRPPVSIDRYLNILLRHELAATATFLRAHATLL